MGERVVIETRVRIAREHLEAIKAVSGAISKEETLEFLEEQQLAIEAIFQFLAERPIFGGKTPRKSTLAEVERDG